MFGLRGSVEYNPFSVPQTWYCRSTVLQPHSDNVLLQYSTAGYRPLVLVFSDLWYRVQAPVRPCTALVQYYRLLVLSTYFPNFLPLMLIHVTYQVGFNINSTVSLVTIFAPHGGLWFESCRWYHVHQVPFFTVLPVFKLASMP